MLADRHDDGRGGTLAQVDGKPKKKERIVSVFLAIASR